MIYDLKSLLFESVGENFIEIILKSIAKRAFDKNKYLMLFLFNSYFNTVYSTLKLYIYTIITKDDTDKKLMIILEW